MKQETTSQMILNANGKKILEKNVEIETRSKQKQSIEHIFNSFNLKHLFQEMITPYPRNLNKEIKVLFGVKAICYVCHSDVLYLLSYFIQTFYF